MLTFRHFFLLNSHCLTYSTLNEGWKDCNKTKLALDEIHLPYPAASALQVKQWKLRRKKCLKVNIYFVLSFKQKQVIHFKWWIITNLLQIFFYVKNVIFGVFGGTVLKYFLSETIYAQENGSRGTHFAKFLISNFLKGLTYSALEERPLPVCKQSGCLPVACSSYFNPVLIENKSKSFSDFILL